MTDYRKTRPTRQELQDVAGRLYTEIAKSAALQQQLREHQQRLEALYAYMNDLLHTESVERFRRNQERLRQERTAPALLPPRT